MVTVYFCDFGDIALITLDNIKPLTSEFLQLPYQAIKAELAGKFDLELELERRIINFR